MRNTRALTNVPRARSARSLLMLKNRAPNSDKSVCFAQKRAARYGGGVWETEMGEASQGNQACSLLFIHQLHQSGGHSTGAASRCPVAPSARSPGLRNCVWLRSHLLHQPTRTSSPHPYETLRIAAAGSITWRANGLQVERRSSSTTWL